MWPGVWWMVAGWLFGMGADYAMQAKNRTYEGAGGGGGGGGFHEPMNGGW